MTIVEFLTARLDEDEQLAHAACGFHDFRPYGASKSKVYTWWLRAKPGAGEPEDILRRRSGEAVAAIRYLDAAAHIARHDPARVLREVAAKRKLMALHGLETLDRPPAPYELPESFAGEFTGYCQMCSDLDYPEGLRTYYEPWPCPSIRMMASVYDDHPDYEQAWRIEA